MEANGGGGGGGEEVSFASRNSLGYKLVPVQYRELTNIYGRC